MPSTRTGWILVMLAGLLAFTALVAVATVHIYEARAAAQCRAWGHTYSPANPDDNGLAWCWVDTTNPHP